MAKQRSSSQRSNRAGGGAPARQARPAQTPGSTPTARTAVPAPRVTPRPARPQTTNTGISPVTIGLVAVVVLALAGFAIFMNQQNQQRAAVPGSVNTEGVVTTTINLEGVPTGDTPEGYPYKGKPDAKVVIDDYSDYQCPHCANFAVNVEPKITEDFIKPGRAKFVFHDFQFLDRTKEGDTNPNGESHRAALAGHCADEQGRFWAMHDVLFDNQGKKENSGAFNDAALESFAKAIELNMDQFRSCMKSQAASVSQLIDITMHDNQGRQVQGTPTFFINGRKVESGDYDTLKAAIELAEKAQ